MAEKSEQPQVKETKYRINNFTMYDGLCGASRKGIDLIIVTSISDETITVDEAKHDIMSGRKNTVGKEAFEQAINNGYIEEI